MGDNYIEIEGYILTNKLGEGTFGKVYYGYKHDKPDDKVAVKLLKELTKDQLEREVIHHYDCKHPNIA